ncbi:FUSC family protein [Alteribacillus iranensis]|nr:aromatic acid exporter family protein [Alteribacillus iranensis]
MITKKKKWNIQFIGGRVLKTGIAVFLTAVICRLFGMMEAFAVITAIVTLEPTAASSIRKGAQRLPASIIGAALAMGFAYVFGPSPMSYTLAAVFTIFACTKLKLQDGTLVATLTAVAMIPVSEGHYFYSFLERVGTTTIGLSVSTLVNLTILPPRFSTLIAERNETLFTNTANVLKQRTDELLEQGSDKKNSQYLFRNLQKDLEKSIQLSYYQKEEMRYHKRRNEKDKRFFTFEQRQLHLLEKLIYHFSQLYSIDANNLDLKENERNIVQETALSIAVILEGQHFHIPVSHYHLIDELDELFWHRRDEVEEDITPKKHQHRFSEDVILLFTLLSIHDELESLEDLHHHENDEDKA